MDRNMMLTPDEYMSLMRLLTSERESEGASLANRENMKDQDKPKRRKSAYSRKYKKAFDQVSKTYKKKNGEWKKNGFKAAVKAAHTKAKKMK